MEEIDILWSKFSYKRNVVPFQMMKMYFPKPAKIFFFLIV